MWNRFKVAWKIAKEIEQKNLTPMSYLPSWRSDKPIWKDWSTENAVKHGYKASTWVYACITRIANSASSVPWKVYRETAEGLEEIPNHPLEVLLKKPNPYMSGQDLFERLVAHLYLGGNGIWSKVRANEIVAELWPISPDQITPIPSKDEFLKGYEYKVDGVTHFAETNDIIHVMFQDPSNPYWGEAPLQTVAKVVDTDSELINFQMVSLQNRAITDGVFSFKQPLTKDQWEEARAMIKEQHMGAGNARTPWVLGGEASWQQMSLSPAEMDFINSRNFSREEICSVFNVPPPMVGLYEHATLSNIETARKIFWLDTVIPLLDDIRESLNLLLTPEFGDDIVINFDLSQVQAIQDNYDDKVVTAERLWKMGIPFNEINQRLELGFEDIEGGDVGYLPLNIIQTGMSFDPNVNVNINEDEDEKGSRRQTKAWNLETEEQKTAYWKALDRRRIGWINQFSSRIETLFEQEADAVAKAYEKDGTEGAFLEITKREALWEQLHQAMYLAIIEEFGQETWDQLKSNMPSETKQGFDPWAAFVQLWISSRAAKMIHAITDTTKDLIQNVIAIGMDEGLGVPQIAKAIRERYSGFSRRRAEVIARTETVASSNFASMASAKQTGLNPKKVWVSSRDDRVRDTHEHIDGTMIGIDDEFKVGADSMRFPGGGTVAEENVNCRCALTYRTQ